MSVTLLVCEMSAIVQYFEHSLALPFFGIGMKTDLFQSGGHCGANIDQEQLFHPIFQYLTRKSLLYAGEENPF